MTTQQTLTLILLRLLQEYFFLQHLKQKDRVNTVTAFFNKVRL